MITKKSTAKYSTSRYAWTGAAIGLYFGFFFRPQREVNFGYALMLALLIAVVFTALHGWRERPSFKTIPAYFAISFVKAALVMSLLEGRHFAFDWGGRTAVVIFCAVMGALSGLWFAYEESRKAGKNPQAKTPKPFKRVDASQVGEERP
jgi:hypothetical protein